MGGTLRASVLVPTYNRAGYLRLCLEGLAAQSASRDSFEVIVVDNNSTDTTREVTLAFAMRHPELRLRYCRELRQSAGHARNRGVAEARGEIVCFLDDDTVASAQWLDAMLAGFADPSVGCAGGPAIPDYQGRPRPPWLEGELQGLLSGYNLPYTEPTPLRRPEQFPFACNLALRRQVFDQVGLFRPELDRVGSEVLTGGETELIGRCSRAGWQILFLPQAGVRHLMAPERLEKRYLYRIGRGLALSHIIQTADRRPRVVARWLASDAWYAARMLLRLCQAIAMRKRLWFDDYMRFWIVSRRIPLRLRLLLRGSLT